MVEINIDPEKIKNIAKKELDKSINKHVDEILSTQEWSGKKFNKMVYDIITKEIDKRIRELASDRALNSYVNREHAQKAIAQKIADRIALNIIDTLSEDD